MLKLDNISEFDLAGWLFVHYPNYLSPEDAREQLEYEILAVWDADEEEDGVPEEERNEELPSISPYWLFRVLQARAHKEIESLPLNSRLAWQRAYIDAIWVYRTKYRAEITAMKMPPLPPPPPFPKRTRPRRLIA